MHICLVGALVLSAGVHSLVEMTSGWIQGNGTLDLGVLLVFIGLGLLRGSNLQRSLFGGLLALALVASFIIMVVSFFSGSISGQGSGVYLIPSVVFFFLLLAYLFGVLWSARGDEWFAQKYSGKAPPYVIPVTVVISLFSSVGGEMEGYNRRVALAKVFRYEVELLAVDANTGEFIEYGSISSGRRSIVDLELPEPMQTGGSSYRGGDVGWLLEGFADEPFEVNLSYDGYQSQSVKIDRSTGNRVEVRMFPLKKK